MGCLQRILLGVVAAALVVAIAQDNAGGGFALAIGLGVVVGVVGRRIYGGGRA
jgi:hypothetical protein